MISSKTSGWILGGVHFVIWGVFGLWVIPTFNHIFADLLAGEPLPVLTQGVMIIGPGGCLLFAIAGGALIIGTHYFASPRWLRLSFVIASGLALVYGIAALRWPFLLVLGPISR